MRAKNLFLSILALLACANTSAREGDLDPSFNGNGKAAFSIDDAQPALDFGNAVAIQADGKIVIAGSTYEREPPSQRWTVSRLNADGSFDPTFGSNGRIAFRLGANTASAAPVALAIQNDGKIDVGGFYDLNLAIARLDVDGTLDAGFANGGIYLANPIGGSTQPFVSAMSLVAQPSGGQLIVFAGGAPTGSGSNFLRGFIDSTGQFPHTDVYAGPSAFSNFNAMVAQGNKFVMVGSSVSTTGEGYCSSRRYRLGYSSFGLPQFFADSSFVPSDFTFGSGTTRQCHVDSAAMLPSGDIVLGAHQSDGAQNEITIAYGLNGADGSANDRVVIDPFPTAFPTPSSVAATADGKVVLAGTGVVAARALFVVQRRMWLSGNQMVDPAFASAGTATIDFDHARIMTNSNLNAIAQDQYGRIVAIGTTSDIGDTNVTRVAVTRLQGDLIFRNGFESP